MSAVHEDVKSAARGLFALMLSDGYKPAGLFPYTTEGGEPLFYRARLDHAEHGKTIRPFYRAGECWKVGEPTFTNGKPLYALPRLAQMRPRDPLVVVVEGEKAANAVNAWAQRVGAAVVAVTSGAGDSAGKANWTPLSGLRCLVWPDHDEPGAKYADAVEAALAGIAVAVERLDVGALSLPPKGDAVEWLEANPHAGADALTGLPRLPGRSPKVAAGWPEPEPLPDSLPPVEPWDWDLLPPMLAARVRCTSSRLCIPPELAAVPLLASLAGVVGRTRQVCIRDGWRVVPNLWGVVVAKPSELKSPALREGTFMLEELERQTAEAYNLLSKDFQAEALLRSEKAKLARKGVGKLMEKNPAAAKERALDAIVDEAEMPPQRRFTVQSFTVEKMGELLRDNPRGITACIDELASLFRQCERSGHEQDRTFLLSAYNGDSPLTWDTLSRGNVRVPHACLSVVGTIQPDPLREVVSEAGSGGDGLLQRFQLMVFPDASGVYAPSNGPIDGAAQAQVAALFKRLAEEHPVDVGGEPTLYRLTPDALDTFHCWELEHRNRIKRFDEENPALVTHLGKYPKTVPALALLFRLTRMDEPGELIELEDVERAIAWAVFLEGHAARVYQGAGGRSMNAARALLGRLRSGRVPARFAARDVYKNGWQGLRDAQAAREALAVLRDFGWVQCELVNTGGRPGESWTVHPSLARSEAA